MGQWTKFEVKFPPTVPNTTIVSFLTVLEYTCTRNEFMWEAQIISNKRGEFELTCDSVVKEEVLEEIRGIEKFLELELSITEIGES